MNNGITNRKVYEREDGPDSEEDSSRVFNSSSAMGQIDESSIEGSNPYSRPHEYK